MTSCPHCGGLAVIEEFTKVDSSGTRRRVTIRRCVSLGRGRTRRRRRKDPGLRDIRHCGEVEILAERAVA